MDKERAKLVLQSYRPGGDPGSDAEMAEALGVAERDAELRAWFAEQQEIDQRLRRKLRDAAPPADLLDEIVAGLPRTASIAPRRRWIQPLALAAAIVLLFGSAALLWHERSVPQGQSFAAFHAEMGSFLKTFPTLDIRTEKHSVVREWLASKPRFASGQIPQGLEKFPAIGCRELEWRGQPAALVCFMVDGHVVHLFLLPKQTWAAPADETTPQVTRDGKWTAATWIRGEITYVTVTRASEEFLKRRLG
jgi:hypothetical protein